MVVIERPLSICTRFGQRTFRIDGPYWFSLISIKGELPPYTLLLEAQSGKAPSLDFTQTHQFSISSISFFYYSLKRAITIKKCISRKLPVRNEKRGTTLFSNTR
jgi:hypothetical protein